MDYKISVYDSYREYKTFLKQHQSIKEQFINNIIRCFMKDEYESSNSSFKKQYTYEEFLDMVIKEYVLYIQTKSIKNFIIKKGMAYMCKVFFHHKNTLLFSCSLEVSPTSVEIHDVCVSLQETGKGRCKEFISRVCNYIKDTFPSRKIKIVCNKKNIPAFKCYTSVFGAHKGETKDLYKFEM